MNKPIYYRGYKLIQAGNKGLIEIRNSNGLTEKQIESFKAQYSEKQEYIYKYCYDGLIDKNILVSITTKEAYNLKYGGK